MEGFFSDKEIVSQSRPDGKTYSCISCGLSKNCEHPHMQAYGNFKRGILLIGEAPTDIDDRLGKPWQSKSGKMLQATLNKLGIDIFEDCRTIHAVSCPTEDNVLPTTYEVDCCRKFVIKEILESKPTVVIAFGMSAVMSIIGHRWKKNIGSINKWRGFCIPDQDLKTWICPTFSPDYIEKFGAPDSLVIWKKDLLQAIKASLTPFAVYKEPKIDIIEDLSVLDNLSNDPSAFDYETTGIKPHKIGHKIICASIADTPDHAYVFMIPKNRSELAPFNRYIESPRPKVAHNMKYEYHWTKVKLRLVVNNFIHDTMLYAHVLDNRSDICSLKFQTYVNFGIIDYDSDVAPYLKAIDNKDGNSINNIEELLKQPGGKKKLLYYCALDTIYELRLYYKQVGITKGINPRTPEAYQLLHEGMLALARAEQQGIRVDLDYVRMKKDFLTRKIKRLEDLFKASTFYRHWSHSFKGNVNIHSNTQLANFLYKVKGIKVAKETESGQGATDDEALLQLGIPELTNLLEIRKLKKIKDTYLEAFDREQVDGYMHPSFNLHLVQTYRSSSDSPNFQNMPKRDEVAMSIVRKALYPRPGHQLLEADFKGIEVAIAACYHKDENMLKYLFDKSSDMHGDMAKQIFILPDFDKNNHAHSILRSAAKNGFVFPQFYGDYYGNNAQSLAQTWGKLPLGKWTTGQGIPLDEGPFTLSDHLISKGINSYDKFVAHMKKIEADFWNNRFPDYMAWKEGWHKVYQKYAYIDTLTGFRCIGPMGKNQTINYPVQGVAFHCLLWTFIRLDEIIREKGWKTRIIGQIHDSIILDVAPDELEMVAKTIKRIITEELKEHWNWIIVPMDVEMELCPVDASWDKKEKYKLN